MKRRAQPSEKEVPKVNKELNGFDIKINTFGEIITSYDLDVINDFLDRNVEDKKLKNRDEFLAKKHPHDTLEEGEEDFENEDNDVLNAEEKVNLIDWEEEKEERDEDEEEDLD